MNSNFVSSPHQRTKRNTSDIMRILMLACVPGLFAQCWFYGIGSFVQVSLCILSCILFEAAVLFLRQKPILPTLNDSSAAVTGLLLGLCLPPLLPWWMAVIGSFFAIVVSKQLYGGLGFNIFNPAMIGYVVLLISFPADLALWLPIRENAEIHATALDQLWVIFTGFSSSGHDITQLRYVVDGATSATPLDSLRSGLIEGKTVSEITAKLDSAQYWIALAYLGGGLILLRLKVTNWHIPISMLSGIFIASLLLYLVDSDLYASPLFHLTFGASIVGAFFIATDPVSASTTPKGRLIFGAAIGFWVVMIRTFGAYPDSVAFAVLIMNMAVPLIDYYTQPRVYGYGGPKGS